MDGYLVDQKNLSQPEVTDRLEALDIGWQIFFIILYSLVSILALCENLLVIFVQLFSNGFEPVLRKCLINLAIADICVGVLSVPFSYTYFMLGHWIFPLFMCPLSQFGILISVFVTVYTLTLISYERYIAIVHPVFHANRYAFIQTNCSVLLVIGWILGCLISCISLTHCETRKFKYKDEDYYDCGLVYDNENTQKAYVLLLFIFTFLLPLLLQTTFYLSIALKIRSLKNSLSVNKIKITKMLAILLLMFAICWLPIRLFFVVIVFNKQLLEFQTSTQYHVYVFTYFIAHFLSMFNSCINPIVYCFMSKSFRDDFWYLFRRTRSQTRE